MHNHMTPNTGLTCEQYTIFIWTRQYNINQIHIRHMGNVTGKGLTHLAAMKDLESL